MAEYQFHFEQRVWFKHCPKCEIDYFGVVDEEHSRKMFSSAFATDSATADGFYGVCRKCVAKTNQQRRKGRDDCNPEQLLSTQDNKCAICKCEISLDREPYVKTVAYVDHDHKTGKIRGLLCHRCNSGLGWIEDGDWLFNAQSYLERSK